MTSLRQQDSFTITKNEGRFWFKESITGNSHSISDDPNITSPERLEAHWKGFVDGVKLYRPTSKTTIKEINDLLKTGRDELRRIPEVDFISRELEVIPLDSDGERIDDLLTYVDSITRKKLNEIFSYDEVCAVQLVSTGKAFDEKDLPIAERWDTTWEVDHFALEILR